MSKMSQGGLPRIFSWIIFELRVKSVLQLQYEFHNLVLSKASVQFAKSLDALTSITQSVAPIFVGMIRLDIWSSRLVKQA